MATLQQTQLRDRLIVLGPTRSIEHLEVRVGHRQQKALASQNSQSAHRVHAPRAQVDLDEACLSPV
eukprot:CAMPEP_0195074162 /NCGR_PEP_ID=MMETSP0448-20130528/17328_1 /TAXON_ID=66468 /ORGANISM="Heterocapsa triquestra, Strain CCMP 448" /LENGTH=65 /DNA_ID=CAMNT_0040106373 /DNA_START=94 /DNA_END=288 /DNA_ORIENTATION=-